MDCSPNLPMATRSGSHHPWSSPGNNCSNAWRSSARVLVCWIIDRCHKKLYFYRMHEIATNPAGHIEQHMRSSEILTDIVIGMSDGLTVPFSLAAGLSAAVGNNHLNLIWIAGIAEIAAGSIAMGLGGSLAGKTEMDHYNAELRREYDEVERVPDREREEVREFSGNLGLI